MSNRKFSIQDLCAVGIFTAIITICAQLSIPMPYGVPMTLQTFAVLLSGIVLGAKKGALSTLVYVLLGAVGVPVFANFTGGLGIVFGPTGGFILSFPLMALAAGIGGSKNKKLLLVAGLVAGAALNYICGVLFFSLIMSADIGTAITVCVLPFILTDIIKIVLAAVLGKRVSGGRFY